MELANKEVRLTKVGSRGDVWLAPLGGKDVANDLLYHVSRSLGNKTAKSSNRDIAPRLPPTWK